ncbi:Uncharacterized protein DAT39_006139, partial [Clarias magur]
LYASVIATALHILKIGTNTLLLHSSGILSLSKILLNKLVRNSTATSPKHFHTST